MEDITNKQIEISYSDLDNLKFEFNNKIGLTIYWEGIKYEFILNLKNKSDKLIILGSGALGFRVFDRTKPYIERHSWNFEHSAIYYHDPTYYVDDAITAGWGIGTENNYYLEKIACILEKIISKLNIARGNILFYGSSAGGFTSLLLSTMIKGTHALADIPQLYVYNFKSKEKMLDTWKDVKEKGFGNYSDSQFINIFKTRLSFVEMIKKENYVPDAYLIMDCSVSLDFYSQYLPFLLELNSIPFNQYSNKIKIIADGKNYGHNPLSKKDTISLINKILSGSDDALVEQHILNNYNSNPELINKLVNKLIKYNTARVDLKFEGIRNDLKIHGINNDVDITQPSWLNNDKGPGYVITSNNNRMNLEITVKGKGNLIIRLRAIDFRDSNRNRLPIYINYTKFSVNGINILSQEKIAWHDNPILYRKKVDFDENIKINIEWEPC